MKKVVMVVMVVVGLGVNLYADISPVKKIEKSCKLGNNDGCVLLGVMHLMGEGGVKKDLIKSSELFEQACNAGKAHGCGLLGGMYHDGVGVKKDLVRGSELLQQACQGGVLEACSEKVETIFESLSGMGINLNQQIKKDASGVFFLKPIEKIPLNSIFKNIFSSYNIKTDNLSCIMDGNLVCIQINKKKVINKMIVVKVYGGALNPDKMENIFNDARNIVLNLKNKYKTSFTCDSLSNDEIQKKLIKRRTSAPVIVASCKSTSIKPKIQVYIDMDGGGGDIVSFYNIEN